MAMAMSFLMIPAAAIQIAPVAVFASGLHPHTLASLVKWVIATAS